MSLTFDQRSAIVARLTAASHASPRAYQFRVLAWILLGYAIIATLLAIALLLTAGGVALILTSQAWGLAVFVWLPAAFGFAIARALFVRMDPPQGRELRRHEAPQLFATIDEIRASVQVPRLDAVLITTDMNAFVVELPRFGGLFGWRRHLAIGLPLLIAMSAEEMRAILAHELAHLSAQHGRISASSWRVRMTWGAVVTSIDARRGLTAGLLQRIMHWYVERLMLVTIVLARKHELAADKSAAELTDRLTAARALAWSAVTTDLLEERFSKPIWERVNVDPKPPATPWNDLLRSRAEIFGEPYDDVLTTHLERKTALDDTHPALRARMQQLGVQRPFIALSPDCAAHAFLGRTTAGVISELDRMWRAYIGEDWKKRHEELATAREHAAADVDPSADAKVLHERAAALVELGRDAAALPLYETLRARDAKDSIAAFQVGRILVQRGELAGIDPLSNAMQLDWRMGGVVCEVVYAALREKGYEKEAFAWFERYEREIATMNAAQAEAHSLLANDHITQTTISDEAQAAIVEICRNAKWVGRVWIARKNLRAVPDGIDFIAVRAAHFRFATSRKFQKLVEALPPDPPMMVFLVESGSLMRKLNRAGARRF